MKKADINHFRRKKKTKKLECHEKVCKNKDFCEIALPTQIYK